MEEKRQTLTARLQQSLLMQLHVHWWFARILAYVKFQACQASACYMPCSGVVLHLL